MLGVRVVEMELGSSQGTHDSVKDTELSSCQGSNHEATGNETNRAELDKANLLGNVDKTGNHGSGTAGSLLVDLGKKGVSGVRDNGRCNSGNNTRSQRDGKVHSWGDFGRCLAHGNVGVVSDSSLDHKLGASVRDLLGQNGEESSVESTKSFGSPHFAKAVSQSSTPGGVRDGANTNSFQWAEEAVSDKLSSGSGPNVNARLVFPGLLFAKVLDGIDLEVFDSSKLEPSLDKVPSSSGSETGGQGHGSLLGNDLSETSDQTLVVLQINQS